MAITRLHLFPSPFILVILLHVLISLESTTSISSVEMNFRVDLEHLSSRSGLTKMQIIQHTLRHKSYRLEQLTTPVVEPAPDPEFQSLLIQAEGEFIMNLSLGTPPRHLSAIMDTGSDLIWTQCMPCRSCYAQPTPIFNPNTSSSFSPLPCSNHLCGSRKGKCETNLCKYIARYGDNSFTEGYLATDTFTLGDSIQNVSIPNLGFGCGNHNGGTGLDLVSGIIGLGRGPLSLVSQLKAKKFSYCLPTIGENKRGTLSFGSLARGDYNNTSNSSGTPLFNNPYLPSYYFISLEGISVDNTRLPIPKSIFESNEYGGSGTILDSGTTLTYLVEEAYLVLKQEFAARVKLPTWPTSTIDLDLCFRLPVGMNASNVRFPTLKFHFKDVVLELPRENYLVDDIDMRMVCLGIMPSPGRSIFGSLQQQNFLVLHDLEKQTVSFFPSQGSC